MDSWSTSALLFGGVGGFEVLTQNKNIIWVRAAGINHIIFIILISLGWSTNNGVNPWPKTIPNGRDIAKTIVAKVRCPSLNLKYKQIE